MTEPRDLSAPEDAPATLAADNSAADIGSRVEAAAAGGRHEHAEVAEQVEPREHVTAAAGTEHPHLHHPEDPNAGVVRGQMGRGALLAAVVAAALTTLGVVALALAIGGH